jgi:hypothetical protein
MKEENAREIEIEIEERGERRERGGRGELSHL